MSVEKTLRIFDNTLEVINKIIKLIKLRITQPVGLYGELEIKHIRDGKVIDVRNFPNIVTYDGYAEVAGLINGVTSGAFTYIAIGIGTTGELVSDSALESEIVTGGGSRASATCTRVTTAQTDDTAQLVWTWTFTSAFAVTESGVLDAASDGELLCRKVFAAINVGNTDQLQITWKIQVSAT